MNDINRNDDDDVNFLDISRYQYSDDDDVELIGQDDVFINMDAPNPSLITTRSQVRNNISGAVPTYKTFFQLGDNSTATPGVTRISTNLLEDSDEELLK